MWGHPYDCTSRKFPMNCRYCGQTVVYWECYHGSKVFFDPPDRGIHACRSSASSGASAVPRADGRTALTTLSGVSVGVQSAGYGLMPGMRRGGVARFSRSWARRPETGARETVRIDPLGDMTETIFGEISDMDEIDLAARFGLSPESIGARILGATFPGLRATRITILVDDFLNDADAVDKMSYTAWCPTDAVPSGIAKRASIIAQISPREFGLVIGVGRRWVVERMEQP